ncbi:VTT domain-containing protein [Saprospiraceae bacterium]|nr:VTT domain-containing protein [Saprospiraceae bacterium]
MNELFESCGYIASFLGTLIEGEFMLLASVMSAKLGYFNYFGGMIAAFFGAFVKDSIKFLLVKKYGTKLLTKKPKLQAKLDSTSTWFEKHPYLYITFYREMYGFGTPILMLSALKNIPYARFAFHSAISIFLWVAIIGGIGYFCAETLIENLNFLKDNSTKFIGGLVVVGLLYWFFFKRPHEKYCYIPIKESAS